MSDETARIAVLRAMLNLPQNSFYVYQIVNETGLARQSVTRILNWLVTDGFAEYEQSGDGREGSKLYRLTHAGKIAFSHL